MSDTSQTELPIRPSGAREPWIGLRVTSDGLCFEVVEVTDLFVRVRFNEPGLPRLQHGVLTRRTWLALVGLITPGVA